MLLDGSGSYHECHGFEIELEDLLCDEVSYTFNYNRYGAPVKGSYTYQDASGIVHTGCIVKYESAYDNISMTWLQTTPVPSSLLINGVVSPTNGHSCFSSGQADYATSGCEHFGMSIFSGKNPTSTRYRWLIEDANNPGTLTSPNGFQGGIPTVTWNVAVGGGANGGNIVAARIQAEPPEEPEGAGCNCWKWGEPRWVKVFKTEKEHEVDLDHLLNDDPDVPTTDEVEIEWVLFQARPTCDEDCIDLALNASENELLMEMEPGDASKSVLYRYETYEYTGVRTDPENEAQPGCESDPPSCNEVGNFLANQMAAMVLGLGDILGIATESPVMSGKLGYPYSLNLMAVGGVLPHTWSLSGGTLPEGLTLSAIDGLIEGTPLTPGQSIFRLTLTDSSNPAETVTKEFTMYVSGETYSPTLAPSTKQTALPTEVPTQMPMALTNSPISSPTSKPTSSLTKVPTQKPTTMPSSSPIRAPSTAPTMTPKTPTGIPTPSPTSSPSSKPTAMPTKMESYGTLSNWDTYCVVPGEFHF